MKKIIASGLLLAVMAGTAFAQTAPLTPTSPAASSAPAGMMQPGSGPVPVGMPDAPPPPPSGPAGRLPPPPPPSKAAHFRLERGDTALDVKCADDETTKTCADIALQMLDKLQTLPASKN